MGRQLRWAATLGLCVAAGLVTSAVAAVEVVRVGNLVLHDGGGITPQKLPRNEQAPIAGHIHVELGTTDKSHLPALKHVDILIDRTIELNTRGLPTCSVAEVTARTTAEAKRTCADAIVGTGEGEVEVQFPESEPFTAKGPIALFNGGVRGNTTLLLIHAYVPVPAPTAVIATAKVSRVHEGRFGLHAMVDVPQIAGGSGSVTAFDLKLSRRFTYRGEQRSFLTARCPTGTYELKGEVSFYGGMTMNVRHDLPCIPAG
jgi:hypothetical protein